MSTPFLTAEEYDERAHELYDAGDYDEALELLREGLQRYPSCADLLIGLGYVRLAREEFAWARQSFERAIELDDEHEDGWAGLGEALLKFGRADEALSCFARIDELGLGDDRDLGLAIGRALYREGMFGESGRRLTALVEVHPESAEVLAALAYTQHALGDEVRARRKLRQALQLDPEFHEARIYLSHLLFERGDHVNALRELERVPPEEHWDPLSLWRAIELKCALIGCDEDDPRLESWRTRVAELDGEPDPIDHLLAEVEAAFDADLDDDVEIDSPRQPPADDVHDSPRGGVGASGGLASRVHRVRTRDGVLFTGTWEQIVRRMRDASADPRTPISEFMLRMAEQARQSTGQRLPCDCAEAFLRASARLGLLHIDG